MTHFANFDFTMFVFTDLGTPCRKTSDDTIYLRLGGDGIRGSGKNNELVSFIMFYIMFYTYFGSGVLVIIHIAKILPVE